MGPGENIHTAAVKQNPHISQSAIGALGPLQLAFTQVMPFHQRTPWCDGSLTLPTSWRGGLLHQGSNRSDNIFPQKHTVTSMVLPTHTCTPPHTAAISSSTARQHILLA